MKMTTLFLTGISVSAVFLIIFIFMLTTARKYVIYIKRSTIVLQKMYELMSGVDMSGLIELEEKPETPAVPDDTWE
jgi:hypothetical protein